MESEWKISTCRFVCVYMHALPLHFFLSWQDTSSMDERHACNIHIGARNNKRCSNICQDHIPSRALNDEAKRVFVYPFVSLTPSHSHSPIAHPLWAEWEIWAKKRNGKTLSLVTRANIHCCLNLRWTFSCHLNPPNARMLIMTYEWMKKALASNFTHRHTHTHTAMKEHFINKSSINSCRNPRKTAATFLRCDHVSGSSNLLTFGTAFHDWVKRRMIARWRVFLPSSAVWMARRDLVSC